MKKNQVKEKTKISKTKESNSEGSFHPPEKNKRIQAELKSREKEIKDEPQRKVTLEARERTLTSEKTKIPVKLDARIVKKD